MPLPTTYRRLLTLIGLAVLTHGPARDALCQSVEPAIRPGERSLLVPPAGAEELKEAPVPATPIAEAVPYPPTDVQQTQAIEVLQEGPVHEAFAEPLSMDVAAPSVITREPPQAVNETPPDYRPDGDNVQWVPGYWMWMEEKSDFVWVSGVWRSIPPGRAWTPGHWAEVDGGYTWVSGFWSEVQAQEVRYLPYPPETLEQGPSSTPPSANHFWIPGCWTWQQQQYAWRAGYWYPGQASWMWVPDHYVHTPRGAVMVSGYWDYPIQRRGLLYAPVYWNGGYSSSYVYRPTRVVNTALLLGSLFVDNNRGYYYYGRGYAARNNYHAWHAHDRSAYYSPMYGYYSWRYGRDNKQWRDHYDHDHKHRHNQRDGRNNATNNRHYGLVGTVDQLERSFSRDSRNNDRRHDHHYRKLTDNERREAVARTHNMHQFEHARTKFEAKDRDSYRARVSHDDKQRNRRNAQAKTPDGYKPSSFKLHSATGADELRRSSRERHERYQQQVMRQGSQHHHTTQRQDFPQLRNAISNANARERNSTRDSSRYRTNSPNRNQQPKVYRTREDVTRELNRQRTEGLQRQQEQLRRARDIKEHTQRGRNTQSSNQSRRTVQQPRQRNAPQPSRERKASSSQRSGGNQARSSGKNSKSRSGSGGNRRGGGRRRGR